MIYNDISVYIASCFKFDSIPILSFQDSYKEWHTSKISLNLYGHRNTKLNTDLNITALSLHGKLYFIGRMTFITSIDQTCI